MKYLVMILLLVNCFFITSFADDGCVETTFYSKKDWVDAYNFIEHGNDASLAFVNKYNITYQINGLGTYHYVNYLSSNQLLGLENYQTSGSESGNQKYFLISLNKDIKLSELEFELEAVAKDGIYKNIRVYLNAKFSEGNVTPNIQGGNLVYHGSSKDRVKLNLPNDTMRNILIVIDDVKLDDYYTLKYFQINKYQVYTHVYWTLDYVADTETYKDTHCVNFKGFSPNGNTSYVKEVNVDTSIDTSLISDYIPKVSSYVYAYDYGRGGYNYYGQEPNIVKSVDNYSYKILGFRRYSYGIISYGDFYDGYIETKKNEGIKYFIYEMKWTPYNANGSFLKSYDGKWCNHVTGSYHTPCYKSSGFSRNNPRYNSYDVHVSHLTNYTPLSDRVIYIANYYLTNTETNEKILLRSNNSKNNSFYLNGTGVYQIEAELFDKANNSNTIKSNNFYLDNQGPEISISPNSSYWTNSEINVQIKARDSHSGMKKLIYTYNAAKETVDNATVLLNKEGIHQIDVLAYDKLDNATYKSSNKYYLDFTKPTVEFKFDRNKSKVEVKVDDKLSKIKYWQYQISYDMGNSYSEFSSKLQTNQEYIYINSGTSAIIKVKAYDNAGNEVIVDSGVIENYQSKSSIEELFAFTYTKNTYNELKINIGCTHCTSNEKRNIKIYLDNIEIESKEIAVNNKPEIFNALYYPIKDTSELKVIIYNKDDKEAESKLIVYGKTSDYQSSENEVNLKAIVASSIKKDNVQKNYYEKLNVTNNTISYDLFQGQGIEFKANYNYENECIKEKKLVCETSNDLANYNVNLKIDNGAIPIKDNYGSNNNYIVPMYIANTSFILNEVYVDKYTGEVFKDNNSNLINGYHRWYLTKDIALGSHDATINGKDTGYNNFSFDLLLKYNVTSKLNEQYDARFIDPNNPNIEDDSIWINSEWFKELVR